MSHRARPLPVSLSLQQRERVNCRPCMGAELRPEGAPSGATFQVLPGQVQGWLGLSRKAQAHPTSDVVGGHRSREGKGAEQGPGGRESSREDGCSEGASATQGQEFLAGMAATVCGTARAGLPSRLVARTTAEGAGWSAPATDCRLRGKASEWVAAFSGKPRLEFYVLPGAWRDFPSSRKRRQVAAAAAPARARHPSLTSCRRLKRAPCRRGLSRRWCSADSAARTGDAGEIRRRCKLDYVRGGLAVACA